MKSSATAKTFISLFFLTSFFPVGSYAQKHATTHTMPMPKQSAASMPGMTMNMHGMYGSYDMMREASGTSWQPQSTPLTGLMFMTKNAMYMLQGFANLNYNHQGGPRGATQTYSTSMFMFMAQKDLSLGTLGFRSMVSMDPLMGSSGYPLLFQTGETADGRTPLVDRQHPHNLMMELAATYSVPVSAKDSVFVYAGLAGEPALGPPSFMMRWSGMDIPEAPLTHHWLDSTHITYGVLTLGYVMDTVKLEVSAFNGREPDQSRWRMESPQFNSHSVRLSYNPSNNLSLQASYGHLKSPEQLAPDVNTNRATVSAIYNQPFGAENNWQTIAAWGQDANEPGHTLNGYLLESALNFKLKHTFFGQPIIDCRHDTKLPSQKQYPTTILILFFWPAL